MNFSLFHISLILTRIEIEGMIHYDEELAKILQNIMMIKKKNLRSYVRNLKSKEVAS